MTGEVLKRAELVHEAMSWLDTPYHHHGRIKGVGVDCAMLLCEVFERCGLVDRVEPGHYPSDWHLNRSDEIFMGQLERAGAVRVACPQPGDIGLFQFGRCFSHGAIVVTHDRRMIHAYLGRGVILTALDEEPLQGREVQWWSLWPELLGEGAPS